MASTIQIQNTINFCLPFVGFKPLNIGANNEPAISIANTVLQTILGPPFVWPWNRSTFASFNTTATIQDYVKSIADFGFIEKVSVGGFECEVSTILGTASSTEASRPGKVSQQIDDNAGNLTFRFLPVPDATYPVLITYQRAPNVITGISNTWSPIPDRLSYIFQYGFLAMASNYDNDAMGQSYSQKFMAHLIGASQGLDETQKTLFMQSWDNINSMSQSRSLRTQQGVQARGY